MASPYASRYRTIINIVRLGRPRFLWLGISLYLLGALLAMASGAAFSADRFVFGYLVLVTGQLSVHYSNVYFDYKADSMTQSGALSGGSRILQKHPDLRPFALWPGLSLAVLSVVLGAVFTIVYAFPPEYAGLVIFGNLLGWCYAAPPVRLAYRGPGEIATMIAVGFLMPGIGNFSQCRAFSPLFMIFSVPLLLYSLSFIINVEVPDLEGDRAGGRNNFIANKGRAFGFTVIGLLTALATAYLAILSLVPYSFDFRPVLLFSFVPLLPALYGLMKKPHEREMALKLVQINVGCYLLLILLINAYLTYIQL